MAAATPRSCNTQCLKISLLALLITLPLNYWIWYHQEAKMLQKVSSNESERLQLTSESHMMCTKRCKHKSNICKRRLPSVLIIGSKKCGTTALKRHLAHHPCISASSHEIHFFDEDYEYTKGIDYYQHQMPLSAPDQITLEKSPRYFITQDVPKRISTAFGQRIRLLLILRDPANRVISDYFHGLRRHEDGSYPSIYDAILNRDKTVQEDNELIATGMYATHLKRWFKYFNEEHLHILDGDVYLQKPWVLLQDVEHFLEIPNYFTENKFQYHAESKHYVLKENENKERYQSPGSIRKPTDIHDDNLLKKLQLFYQPYNAELRKMGVNMSWY